jgi:hypothetical protein
MQWHLSSTKSAKQNVSVREKGGLVHRYQISAQGFQAVKDFIENERK